MGVCFAFVLMSRVRGLEMNGVRHCEAVVLVVTEWHYFDFNNNSL